jgi:hypothetical protein
MRAERVVSLIDDLTQLELLENAENIAAACEALKESDEFRPWDEVKETRCPVRSFSAGKLRSSSAHCAMRLV